MKSGFSRMLESLKAGTLEGWEAKRL